MSLDASDVAAMLVAHPNVSLNVHRRQLLVEGSTGLSTASLAEAWNHRVMPHGIVDAVDKIHDAPTA